MISMMKDDVAVSLASNSPSGVEETPAGHSAGDSNAASNSPDQRMSVQSPDPDRLPPVQPFPRALTEAPRADSAQSRGPTRDLDVAHNSSSNGIGAARGVLPAAERPSIAGRIFRGVASFLIMTLTAALTAFLISFALTHGDRVKEIVMTWGSSLAGSSSDWQSRGDEAKMMVKEAWASSIKWLTENSPLGLDPVAKQKSSASKAPPVAATVSFGSLEQFKTMAQDLTVVRQKLEQLAAAQQQMTQNIASLQALQQEIKQKELFQPLPAPAASVPSRKNERTVAAPQAPRLILRDWRISNARNGAVYVQGHGEIYRVVPGTPLPGLGSVEEIKRQNGRWVVMTPKGIIASMRDLESDEDMFDGY
jgi:hypothetical protein